MATGPTILNVHTPISSFAIVHSLTQDSLTSLFDKLSQKVYTDYRGLPVGPGWLKYEYNGTIWDLNDESDYAILGWRQKEYQVDSLPLPSSAQTPTALPNIALGEPGPSKRPLSYSVPEEELPPVTQTSLAPTPTLHLHNPTQPVPGSGEYHNPAFYMYRPLPAPARQLHSRSAPSSAGRSSSYRNGGRKKARDGEGDGKAGVPRLMKEFEKFHNENGVRTVIGSIGPVKNVRMLLKAGYRHVYISRRFAQKHGFIPADAMPGNYGYGGLVNIGVWPITLVTAPATTVLQDDSNSIDTHSRNGHPTTHLVEADGSIHEDGPTEIDHKPRTTMSGDFDGESLLRTPKKAGAIGPVSASRIHGIHGGRSTANLSTTASRANNVNRATSVSPQPFGRHRYGHDPSQDTKKGIAEDMLTRKTLLNESMDNYGRTTEALKLTSHSHSQDKYIQQHQGPYDKGDQKKPTVTHIQVYLSEEPHFDVVLGRSFFEKRQIKTSATDPTDVICLDTGERIECELVILKDGKGEIVTVT